MYAKSNTATISPVEKSLILFWQATWPMEEKALDITSMTQGAAVFEGEHDFRRFCPAMEKTPGDFVRTIHCADICPAEAELPFLAGRKGFGFSGSGERDS